jgi:hypothetical protein
MLVLVIRTSTSVELFDLRVRHVLHSHVARSVVDDCFHGSAPRVLIAYPRVEVDLSAHVPKNSEERVLKRFSAALRCSFARHQLVQLRTVLQTQISGHSLWPRLYLKRRIDEASGEALNRRMSPTSPNGPWRRRLPQTPDHRFLALALNGCPVRTTRFDRSVELVECV